MVIGELKNRRLGIKEILIGGGGNEAGHCRKMSLEFIKAEVEKVITRGTLEPPAKDWEQVNFA
jgi:hypothetical protein